jgi:lipid-binding SYLF domain-containing protein
MMNLNRVFSHSGIAATVVGIALAVTLIGCASPAKDMEKQNQLEADVDAALAEFYNEAPNGREIVENAEGVLVCPKVMKAGLIIGAEGGTCAMQIDGQTTDYYRTSSLKGGLLAGVESHALLLVFNDPEALAKFREGNREWKVGAGMSVAVAKKGASGGFDTKTMGDPITAFVFSEAGLMADLSLEGTTFEKLEE